MQVTSHEEWVNIAKNLNQIRACIRALQSKINYMNRDKGFEKTNARLETARRNLKKRYEKEYPDKGDAILFDNSNGLELVLDQNDSISPKHVWSEEFKDDFDFRFVSSVPESYSEIEVAELVLDPENPEAWDDLSMKEWEEVAEIVEVLEQSYEYLFSGPHNLPKSAFNDFTLEKAINKLKSDLEEQMFDEHPGEATIDVFY